MDYRLLMTFEECDAFFAECETTSLALLPAQQAWPAEDVFQRLVAAWTRVRDGLLSLAASLADWLSFAQAEALRNLDEKLMGVPAAAAFDVCGLWSKSQAVVKLLLGFPLFPAAWKARIQPVVDLLNLFCPKSQHAPQ